MREQEAAEPVSLQVVELRNRRRQRGHACLTFTLGKQLQPLRVMMGHVYGALLVAVLVVQ